MNDYFIQLTNNIVCVKRIINGELEAIKIKGDLQFPLCDFWLLFKHKIEYEADETLAFIVFTDDKNFEIDSEIIIAKTFVSAEEDLNALIFENLTENIHLVTYPQFELNTENIMPSSSVEVQPVALALDQEIKADSLQSFFRKKTREIKRENKQVTGGK